MHLHFSRAPVMPLPVRPWSLFFLGVSAAVVAAMMLPTLFGLEKYTQWGGMYTDSWCRTWVYSGDPNTGGPVSSELVVASTVGPPPVFSASMHNHAICAMWARTVQCGRVTKAGWTVRWVSPELKGVRFLGPRNACDIPLDPHAEWFRPQPW